MSLHIASGWRTWTRDKALLAILKPAEAFGLPVEESLRERLLDDLEDQGLGAGQPADCPLPAVP